MEGRATCRDALSPGCRPRAGPTVCVSDLGLVGDWMIRKYNPEATHMLDRFLGIQPSGPVGGRHRARAQFAVPSGSTELAECGPHELS